MFREHVAVGAILSMVVVVAVYFYALLTDPLLLMFLFAVTVVGSFLPDVDSDSGIPFYLVFGTMTLAATGVVLLYTLNSTYAADWRYLTGIPAAALFVFWFIVGGVVKKCTHHRGIFHSIPALAISGVGSFLVARYYGLDEQVAWIFGGAMAVGYLCHLLLDELHAGITLDGIPFNPKSSFGSALKLFSNSSFVNTATYVLLAALVYTALQAPRAEAYYNDSDVIEISGDPPPPPEEDPDEGGGTGDDDEGNGGGADGGEDSGGETGGSGSGGGSGGGGGGGSGGSSGGSGTGGSGSGSSGPSEEDVIEALLGNSAIEGWSDFGEGSVLSGNGSAAVFTVVGEKVREALRNRTDLQDFLANWKNIRQSRGDARDYGLVAASTALGDANVQDISFTADAFEIRYRSRGYLIGIFPWSFPVRVGVIPQASEGSRVTVTLPWYRFFVREFFTPAGLASDIEEAMKAALAESGADDDERAILLDVVAQLLRAKVGTVSDSILLGT